MLPPRVADLLVAAGHDATTPMQLGAHNLPDDVLIEIAARELRVIVTENARDFAMSDACPVLLIRKSWRPHDALAERIALAIGRWARAIDAPGPWAHWMTEDLR